MLLGSIIFFLSASCVYAQTPGPNDQPSSEQSGTRTAQAQQGKRQSQATDPQAGDISGTVADANGDLIPGSAVVIEGQAGGDRRTVIVDDNGSFLFRGLKPGTPYRITASAKGFANWTSSPIVLTPGQFEFLKEIQLTPSEVTTITVVASPAQIAVEQVQLEEKQRVLGIIPNFYVAYDPNAAPLTTKLKFQLALRVSVDPVSFLGAAFVAGINQAADRPDYVQGAKGYGQRMGAIYADGFTDILFGGAILPSLLHQDPRYFYQGTGSNKSRALHAISNPFICRGDNGRLQPNYSSIGGDLISSAFSYSYYPSTNRNAGLFYQSVLISTGERTVSSLVQEFVLRKLTPSARNRN